MQMRKLHYAKLLKFITFTLSDFNWISRVLESNFSNVEDLVLLLQSAHRRLNLVSCEKSPNLMLFLIVSPHTAYINKQFKIWYWKSQLFISTLKVAILTKIKTHYEYSAVVILDCGRLVDSFLNEIDVRNRDWSEIDSMEFEQYCDNQSTFSFNKMNFWS